MNSIKDVAFCSGNCGENSISSGCETHFFFFLFVQQSAAEHGYAAHGSYLLRTLLDEAKPGVYSEDQKFFRCFVYVKEPGNETRVRTKKLIPTSNFSLVISVVVLLWPSFNPRTTTSREVSAEAETTTTTTK